jgi:hypothetical protein
MYGQIFSNERLKDLHIAFEQLATFAAANQSKVAKNVGCSCCGSHEYVTGTKCFYCGNVA